MFPNYKKNKYLTNKKGLYLKNFNYILASIIYILEKNKMNQDKYGKDNN